MGSLDPSITFRTLHKQIIFYYWIHLNSCYFPCYFQCCFPPAPCLLFLMKTLRASISFYKNCKQVYVQENEEIRFTKIKLNQNHQVKFIRHIFKLIKYLLNRFKHKCPGERRKSEVVLTMSPVWRM